MSYNGSGTFNINSSGQPVVTGTVISSTAFNALTADLGTGLSTAITKDGQTTTTAVIPFAAGMSSTTGVFTGKITATTAGIDVPITALGTVHSGTYTPTITAVTNIASSVAKLTSYIRVGNAVTVGGYFTATSSGAGSCELTLSLPVASNLAADWDLGGAAVAFINATTQYPIMVEGLAASDAADFYFNTTGANSHIITFQFMYIVK